MSLKICNLQFSYDERVILKDINLEFERGKFYSIIGPNGSGKSTLVKNILGILKKDTGTLTIDGKEFNTYSNQEISKILSYVPQNITTDFDFTIEEMVSMGRFPYLKRFENLRSEDKLMVDEALRITKLLELKDKKITKVSGGELQRASVARCIAQDTDFIILDEPVNHLDISHQVEIMKSLSNMTPQKTIITVMHDLNLASLFSDEIILMDEGVVKAFDEPEKVINNETLKEIYDLNFISLVDENNTKYIFPKI